MRKLIYNKLIYYFIILSPIIDIITSFMIKNNINLTIGIISKMIILALSVIYLLFIDKKNRKINFMLLFILFIFSVLNILNNTSIIDNYLFTYFSYLFKYIYHIIILLFFVRVLKEYPIKICELRIPLLITTVCYIIAFITKTDFQSYAYSINKVGSSGWYSSANELGNLLCLFFPISIYNAFENKDGIKFDTVICILIGICMLLLGTKVGLLGYFLVLIAYLVLRLIFIKHNKINKKYLIALIMLVIPLLLLNSLPAVKNIKYVYKDSNSDINYVVNSGRDEFNNQLKEQYNKSNEYSKIIGKIHVGNKKGEENILIIEQDFYDILYMYGYLGIIIMVLGYLIVYLALIKKIFNYYRKHNSISKKSITILIAVSLELLIAFISGHSLLSPSVSTYLTLFAAISINLEFKNEKDYKKKILISNKDELYKKINKDKYEITILNTNNKEIDDYETISIKKIETRSKLLNKMIAFFLVKNQKYDYVITDKKNNDFENTYLLYSNALSKLSVKDKIIKEFCKN